MNCLSLNCRGLGNPDAVGGLRNLLRREAPALVFLCETKLSSCEMRRVTDSLTGYCSMAVDSVGRSGGLAFLWREDICDRHLSWQFLKRLAEENHSSWLCIGDFNEILYATEMRGGSRAQWQMNNFWEVVDVCGLCDLSYEGYEFTYDNGQGGVDNKQCRLDRAMKMEAWSDQFPYAKLYHLNRECWRGVLGKQFRFEQIWVGEEGCEDTIRRVWEADESDGLETISRCTVELKKWKGMSIGKILRDLEEVFWRQRSRALWLREGDRNTKYFHRKARQRKKKNTIHRVVGRNGAVCEGREAVTVEAEGFFTTLFESSRPEQVEGMFDGVRGRVTTAMNAHFRAAYRAEEVFEALSQMHPLKASGPDEMNALFYQTYWHIVGPSVTRMVLGVLNGENKSAFTPGRLISDNILLAFELFHYMKNSRTSGGHLALKLDMAKAYDRVE
ncbi:uncharacterized protein LOC141602026 [Silene latifolia]|uniref:uncharacterized protein LOC141602026 n=1 Tax=Silene latifolia TaxID=37657 RepID=UPI003D76C38C